jgi:hypothetical protein
MTNMTRSGLEVLLIDFFFAFFPIQNHAERAPEDEWLDIVQHPVFSPDGDSFLILAGIQESESEHFTHIKHVTITQQRIAVISHGRYEVIDSIGCFLFARICCFDNQELKSNNNKK